MTHWDANSRSDGTQRVESRREVLLMRLLFASRHQPLPLFVVERLIFFHNDNFVHPTLGKPNEEGAEQGECYCRSPNNEDCLRECCNRPRECDPEKHRRED